MRVAAATKHFPNTDARLQYLGGVDDSVEVVFGYRTELQRDTVVVREVRRKVDQSVVRSPDCKFVRRRDER